MFRRLRLARRLPSVLVVLGLTVGWGVPVIAAPQTIGLLDPPKDGNRRRCAEAAAQGRRTGPSLVEAQRALGNLALESGDHSTAKGAFDAVLAWEPNDAGPRCARTGDAPNSPAGLAHS